MLKMYADDSVGYQKNAMLLSSFPDEFDGALRCDTLELSGRSVPRLIGEFWTARQRQASSLHEISYRACFKPQLPRYFIERLTEPGDIVYDPFSGRGTTAIEAALLGRRVIANDINPLSAILTMPRLRPPSYEEVAERLERISPASRLADIDLSMFFHPDTERSLVGLRDYLLSRQKDGLEDDIDAWIRMVATNRLTGHSRGFFSVYTLPPNQAASPERQRRINARLNLRPEFRDIKAIILRKTASLQRNLTEFQRMNLSAVAPSALILTNDARCTSAIPAAMVQLTVTSPPFLDVVQYAADNWLRCWFNNIIVTEVSRRITMARKIEPWVDVMRDVFRELYRITKPGGWLAFEVGEVRRGQLRLDEYVAPLGQSVGFTCVAVLINQQRFTKTSNIWGISNNQHGTNTNRIVVFRRE